MTERSARTTSGDGEQLPRHARAVIPAPAVAAMVLLATCASGAGAQAPAALPFFAGERLEYVARVAAFRASGTGTMWIEGPVDVRGHQALHLRFDFSARLGPLKVEDRTESWLDPVRMAALRFRKYERHPMSRHEEQVELFPEERRWTAAGGAKGTSPTDAPLDELSFMYLLRTLPLDSDTLLRLERHYDAARSPTTVRVIGRESVTTPAGTFAAVVVEMRVRDPRRYRGQGVIRISLSDDACRLPLRIESRMPEVGTAVLTLTAHNHAGRHHGDAIAR